MGIDDLSKSATKILTRIDNGEKLRWFGGWTPYGCEEFRWKGSGKNENKRIVKSLFKMGYIYASHPHDNVYKWSCRCGRCYLTYKGEIALDKNK